MSEYIDRDLTIQKIVNIGNENYEGKSPNIGMVHAAQIVKSMPSADVAPVIHAKWVKRSFVSSDVFCSECRTLEKFGDSNYKSRYCPHCGAKMDLTDD